MSMRGHGMGGGGRGGGWGGMRSVRQDRAVLQHRVKKGTARRMLTFAVPYRKILAVFLPVVILDAAISAVNPLILRALIDNGILKKDSSLVIQLAVLVAVLALADAGLVLTERRISAYIGESLIFDMRSKVFRHIQRMPLAFFSTWLFSITDSSVGAQAEQGKFEGQYIRSMTGIGAEGAASH